MSRKITQESVDAFLSHTPFRKSNMEVSIENGITYLKLHGNTIAAITPKNDMWVTNAGWSSNTTKERLNGIPGVNIYQKNFQWYLNGVAWNGDQVYVRKR